MDESHKNERRLVLDAKMVSGGACGALKQHYKKKQDSGSSNSIFVYKMCIKCVYALFREKNLYMHFSV